MAKLYFRYGAMCSAKTINLLAVAHNYEQQGKRAVLVKPQFDDRFSKDEICSRAGLKQKADIILDKNSKIDVDFVEGAACILVDEIHFLSISQIEQLRMIATELNIPVICYGLRSNYKSLLFEGSKRLLELADSIEEVKSTCHYCNRKSIMNMRHNNGVAVISGDGIELGAEDKYYATCFSCYDEHLKKANTTWKQ